MQLNGFISDSCSVVVDPLRKFLREHGPAAAHLQDLLALFWRSEKSRLVLALDEANVLVAKYPNTFQLISDPTFVDRPLFTVLAHQVSPKLQPSLALVIAGTAVGLRDRDVLLTAVAKSSAVENLTLEELTFGFEF